MYRAFLGTAAAALLSTAAAAQGQAPQANHEASSNRAINHGHSRHSKIAASGANSFTEGQARGRITKAGYSRVSHLEKDQSGLWQGTAHKGRRTVRVALDYKGNVVTK
jgi:putative membrane protein